MNLLEFIYTSKDSKFSFDPLLTIVIYIIN